MNLSHRSQMTTSTLRAPEGHRRLYRQTIRRLIGTPRQVESAEYPLPLSAVHAAELDGFRQAAEDLGYVVEVAVSPASTRRLRAWAPRLHAWWISPITEEQFARAVAFASAVEALGYRVEWSVSDGRVDIRAWRSLPLEDPNVLRK